MRLYPVIVMLIISIAFCTTTDAQQYKLRQSTGIMNMKTETTIYVKGMRKRTESAGMMGVFVPTTIEQCDKQRTIKLNDKKKLYFIEPFTKEDVIDDDVKTAAVKTKPVAETVKSTQKGGTIHMWYTITDTGERKKMNGFTARHIWTTQKIKPSADACTMKDSLIIKTDGWYIDLPEFNCPIRYTPSTSMAEKTTKPDCLDKYVTHRSGKGKLGFPLTETRTIIMGGKKAETSEFTTDLQTIEFASMKLDSMLFEIPPGYTQTMNEADLQEKMDMQEMMKQYKDNSRTDGSNDMIPTEKKPGTVRLGVYPINGDGLSSSTSAQQSLSTALYNGKFEAVTVNDAEDASQHSCDYAISTQVVKVKQASKVGGLLKAIKNTDPTAASSYNVEAVVTLTDLATGSVKATQNVSGKYEGKPDDAIVRALEEGCRQVLKSLK